jgi:hypothetical protein
MVNNGNKILSDLGHQTILEILQHNSEISKIIPHLCAHIHSKSTLVRLRTAQYFEIVMSGAPFPVLEANTDLIDLFLVTLTDDQNQEVRNQARLCFAVYGSLLPDKSTVLLMHGIKSLNVRKSIVTELGLDLGELNCELQRIENECLDDKTSSSDVLGVPSRTMKEKM